MTFTILQSLWQPPFRFRRGWVHPAGVLSKRLIESKIARIRTSCFSFDRISSFFSSDVLGFFNEAWAVREEGGQAHIPERRDRTLDL